MSQAASALTRRPAEIVRDTPVSQAPNGICYAASGEISVPTTDLERMVAAVPKPVAAALVRNAYYFVPLTVNQGDDTVIADRYDVALSDHAVCHRNLDLGDSQCVFISTRLMDDKFSVAFEFYINVGHAMVEPPASPPIFPNSPGSRSKPASAARPPSTPGSRASSPPRPVPTPRSTRTTTSTPPSPMPSPSIFCRCISTWTTTTSANETIHF